MITHMIKGPEPVLGKWLSQTIHTHKLLFVTWMPYFKANFACHDIPMLDGSQHKMEATDTVTSRSRMC